MDQPTRPNVLLICTDQQRYDALGCYGNEQIDTPHIDGLAQDGVLFENCYVQSPVCAPSRASLLTGQYASSHGLWANGVSLRPDKPLFTRTLADDGYDCGLIGKMHLAPCFGGRTEERHDDGFRFYEWAHDPSHRSPENAYHRWLRERFPDLHAAALENPRRPGPEPIGTGPLSFDIMPTEAHYSHWVGERAIAFLEQERNPEKPFFVNVNFYDPHHPFVAPQEYLDRYDPATLPSPAGDSGDLSNRPAILSDVSQASYAGHARGFADFTGEEIRQVVRAYYAMVSVIDDEVGRILAALDRLGLAGETLVIFTSDHGEMLGDHGLLLKGPMLYEGATRVPLVLRWPGTLPAGERRADLVEWIDLCGTCLEAAAAPPLPGDQGESLLPLARGEAAAPTRGWALCEYRDSGHPYNPPSHATMLRRGDHKLIVHHAPPATDRPRAGELYDLAADPREERNLWDAPAFAPVRIDLERMLIDVLVAIQDRSAPREAFW
jgi:arylsulfatase